MISRKKASLRVGRKPRSGALGNVQLTVKDAAKIDDVSRYDFITAFDSIHDQAHPRVVLKGIAQALRPDGTFLMGGYQQFKQSGGELRPHPGADVV